MLPDDNHRKVSIVVEPGHVALVISGISLLLVVIVVWKICWVLIPAT